MYTNPLPPPVIREQEYAPLLFAVQPLDQATPRAATPLRADTSSLSTQQRRSVPQTPGSMATDATPPPPPPIMRLAEDVVMDDPGSAVQGATPPGRQAPPQPSLSTGPALQATAPAPAAGGLFFEQQQPPYDDVWVTVFGFTQQDVSLVLKEFHRCGDIISWGTFGEPHANFIHVQYQNKYGAQRALLRNGQQLTASLIIGVKPLDPRHRQRVAQFGDGPEDGGQMFRPKVVPERPYRVEAVPVAQPVPQPSRGVLTRVYEYVLGL